MSRVIKKRTEALKASGGAFMAKNHCMRYCSLIDEAGFDQFAHLDTLQIGDRAYVGRGTGGESESAPQGRSPGLADGGDAQCVLCPAGAAVSLDGRFAAQSGEKPDADEDLRI